MMSDMFFERRPEDIGKKFHRSLTLVWWIFLFVGSMYLMLVTAERKTIVIAGGSYEQGAVEESSGSEWEHRLELESTLQGTGVFVIPLDKNTKAEDVVVENCYMDRSLHILLKSAKAGFYEGHAVQGDVAAIRSAGWEEQRRGVLLKFEMDSVYEYRTSMDQDMLRIEVCDPHALYRLLVVVDAMDGSLAQTQIIQEVLQLIPAQLAHDNIRLYFTGTEDEEITAEERLAFVEEVNADLFLTVGVAEREDAGQYGICGWYNESYFIPQFGNVEFADIVTRNVTIASGNRAIGLKSAEADSILQDMRIPAAGVDLGNLNNEQERVLLVQESYREKLAQGIAEAIREVYTNYYE